MMDDLHEVLVRAPWWVGPIAVCAMFVLVRFVVPWLLIAIAYMADVDTKIVGSVDVIFRMVAPALAFLVSMVWLVSLISKRRNAKRLDSCTDIATIRALSWRDFEELLAEAYRRRGYAVQTTATGPDGGVDLVLSAGGESTFVQCKQWRVQKVGVKPVRELLGVVASQSAARGIFVTSGDYTADARRFADTTPIELVDGNKLVELISSVRNGKSSTSSDRTQETPPSTQRPKTRQASPDVAPACPRCGGSTSKRVAKKGQHQGKAFWGCDAFPRCRGLVEIDHNRPESQTSN